MPMKLIIPILAVILLAVPAPAEMTREQKAADLMQLASLYAKNYGPYEWKRDALGIDILNLGPWLTRAASSKDDLDFYQVCIDYVASLQDGHDQFTLPSIFSASLGFNVDIYDGKVLVDSITRSRLPAGTYPFQIGDELISVDGVPVEDLIRSFSNSAMFANPGSTRRAAAGRIVNRPQSVLPRAHEIGDTASVVVRLQAGGDRTFTIPWLKFGTPLTFVGPVPSPRASLMAATSESGSATDYLEPWLWLRNERDATSDAILNFGSRTPIYNLPTSWTPRLGRRSSDFFISGTFPAGGYTMGLIRVPTFLPDDENGEVQTFAKEIDYMKTNTDGLIIDITRNTGGDPCFRDALMRYLIPSPFRTLSYEIRATRNLVNRFEISLLYAQIYGAPQGTIDQFARLLQSLTDAYAANRGRTVPVPVCSATADLDPASDESGFVLAYDKPIMLVTDEFSVSAAEGFAAVFQDNKRGPIFGKRTNGMGGSVVDFGATNFSEGHTRVTVSLMSRKDVVSTPDYPTARYVENIGVRPDLEYDYMTRANLLNGYRPFVTAMTEAMVKLIGAGR